MLRFPLFHHELTRVLRISGPLMLAMSGRTLMMIVDRLCLAAYSEQTLTASGPAVFMGMSAISFFSGVTQIGRSVIAEAYARSGIEAAHKMGGRLFAVAILCVLGLILTLPLLMNISQLSGRPEEVVALENVYLSWAMLFGSIMILDGAASCYFGAIGNTRLIFKASIAGQLVSMPMTYLLVFGAYGFPELGMAGSAIGTVLGSLAVLIVYLRKTPRALRVAAWTETRALLSKSRRALNVLNLFKRGMPLGAHDSTDEIGNTAIIWAVAIVGTTALAANNFNVILNYIGIIPVIGIANGATILSSQAIGRNQYDRIPKIISASLFVAFSYVAIVTLILQSFDREITSLFSLGSYGQDIFELSVSVTSHIWYYAVAFAVSFIASGMLQSFHQNTFVFKTRILTMWFGSVPASYLIAYNWSIEEGALQLIWISLSTFELALGLLFTAKIFSCLRDRNIPGELWEAPLEQTETT
ncbi:polysaccharide biosynthesis C-terminal domain-containing protein (plasmid) [Pseudovibrio brasiliensis]|uniref:Polysaccharide biosynthesis C-terminal domain-containing protein n=3 Tax=Pseudovibrio brasiliensis TaxID=1898042 RepID=A0ABX8AYY7_9HYPH|nr:polysaccharide biosynthesis C-terminal domain-containing protein [Pseudovibrio brasiliensis]